MMLEACIWGPNYCLARRSLTLEVCFGWCFRGFGCDSCWWLGRGFGGDFWRLMMLCLVMIWLLWLMETLLHWRLGDLTFDLVYILSWISRALFTCLGLELIMMRIDDVTRWDDDQTNGYAVAMTVPTLLFLQAGSCTLWGLDSSNPSWLDPREH